MTAIVNGLPATKTRLALMRAITYDRGRISYDPREKVVWDHVAGVRVTARVEELLRHEWIRALEPDEPRAPGELPFRTYYRPEAYGRAALRGGS